MKLALSELATYFAEKNAKTECPVCGVAQWRLHGVPWELEEIKREANPDPQVSMTILKIVGPGGYEEALFSLACINCGFLRNHAFDDFIGWLGARQSAAANK